MTEHEPASCRHGCGKEKGHAVAQREGTGNLKPKQDFYSQELPGPTDVLWLVEIGEASVKPDREIKAPLYAKAGIPEYWLVDLPARMVEVYRNPGQGRYQSRSQLRQGESIRPVLFPEMVFHLSEILG